MSFRLRFATPNDAAAILEIYGPIVSDTTVSFELDVPSVETMRQRIAAKLERFPWLVAERTDDSLILGYAYAGPWRERIAYQWTVELAIYVRQGVQRAGVGRALYSKLIELLKLQGFTAVMGVISLPNDASIALHHRLGFETIGTFPKVGFKFGRWIDVAFLQLQLCDNPPSSPQSPLSIAEAQTLPQWNVEL
jgi:L-amino acid N-acyltransferase YncA